MGHTGDTCDCICNQQISRYYIASLATRKKEIKPEVCLLYKSVLYIQADMRSCAAASAMQVNNLVPNSL